MNSGPKACPFCGGKAQLHLLSDFYIQCEWCGAMKRLIDMPGVDLSAPIDEEMAREVLINEWNDQKEER